MGLGIVHDVVELTPGATSGLDSELKRPLGTKNHAPSAPGPSGREENSLDPQQGQRHSRMLSSHE